jgi:RNA recognition motif-containing protein
LIVDRETGRPKGFCFVEMDSRETADAAKEKFNGHNLHGHTLKVNEAKPRILK